MSADGKKSWNEVKDFMGRASLPLGPHASYWLRKSPRRLLHAMSYAKFAAKMIGVQPEGREILEVGCAEGLGAWLLAKECGPVLGLDLDAEAIDVAKASFQGPARFECRDFLDPDADLRGFGGLVSLDVIEHIRPENAVRFWTCAAGALADDGVAVIGTPSLESQQYASEVAKAGHVNCYSGARLREEALAHFHHAFLFGGNDEVVHTGFPAMCHYLIVVCCRPRRDAAHSANA